MDNNRLLYEDDIIKAVDKHTKEGSNITLDADISVILEELEEADAISKEKLLKVISEIDKLPRSTITAPTAIIGVNKTHYLIEYDLVKNIFKSILGI